MVGQSCTSFISPLPNPEIVETQYLLSSLTHYNFVYSSVGLPLPAIKIEHSGLMAQGDATLTGKFFTHIQSLMTNLQLSPNNSK